MPSAVDESWDIIVGWLGRHSPTESALFGPPASEETIRHAEAALGTALPNDLIAWWRRANGQSGEGRLLPPFYAPYSVQHALDGRDVWLTAWNEVMEQASPNEFAAYVALQDRAPAGSPCKDAWLRAWLPVAGDGGGNDLFVDLRPGPAQGCVREFRRDGGASDTAWWSSVAAMLGEVADAFMRDVPVQGYRMWVDDDGAISWENDRMRWSLGRGSPVELAKLRARFAAFVAEARAGGFIPPAAGSWSAEWIVAHVLRNTELVTATTEAVLADDPTGLEQVRAAAYAAQDWPRFREVTAAAEQANANVRYDNSDAMDPATLDRYAASGLATLASQVEELGERLCDLIEPLNRTRTVVHVHIVDGGVTIIDGRERWLAVLGTLSLRQLPLRTRQLRALR
jgi:cell wall assembly regulator SMI1